MFAGHLLYDLMIYFYALGLVCYLADFLEKSWNARRIGTGVLLIVWLLQAVFFTIRSGEKQYIPVTTSFEALFFFSWVVVTVSLAWYFLFRHELVTYILSFFGFILLLCALLGDFSMMPISNGDGLKSQLLLVHIFLGISSYALFLISAILSGVYLFIHGKLKERKWSVILQRLPSLENTSYQSFRAVVLGNGLVFTSICLGFIWILLEGDLSLILDPKSLTSLLLFGTYSFYILLRWITHASPRLLAYWNISSCFIIFLNLIVSFNFSGFHHWISF